VTHLETLVAAREGRIAGSPTRELTNVARQCFPQLVGAIAVFASEDGAGWADGAGVAVMLRGMVAGMAAAAGGTALGRLRTTGNGREHDALPTLAVQLLKAGHEARWTIAFVAELRASVLPTLQRPVAGKWAQVLDLDAAQLIALVLPTAPFL